MTAKTREEWLGQATERLLALVADRTELKPPKKVQASVGFPQQDRNGKVIGQCWASTSGNGVSQVFISPTLKAPIKVLETLLHELIHAADDCQHAHKGPFGKAIRQVGLAGKPTATTAKRGSELYQLLQLLANDLGPYPHAGLKLGYRMTKKQTTRMIKCECDDCGYTVRTTKKWLEVAVPTCPHCYELRGHSPHQLTVETKEEESE